MAGQRGRHLNLCLFSHASLVIIIVKIGSEKDIQSENPLCDEWQIVRPWTDINYPQAQGSLVLTVPVFFRWSLNLCLVSHGDTATPNTIIIFVGIVFETEHAVHLYEKYIRNTKIKTDVFMPSP